MSTGPSTNTQSFAAKDTQSVHYVDTLSAYELWSDIYDTDGNFLQALDTIEMKRLLPEMISLSEDNEHQRIVDLGCGTGRSTVALLSIPNTEVTGLDFSPKMLDVAKRRIDDECRKLSIRPRVNLLVFDMLTTPTIPTEALNSDAIVSTLVIEHVPLNVYFNTVARMLKSGGLCLLTNMHSDMGKISQAGFIDPQTGNKIRPTSYAHTVQQTIEVAAEYGLEVIHPFQERTVDIELAPQLGPRAEKWIGVTVWFGGIFRKI